MISITFIVQVSKPRLIWDVCLKYVQLVSGTPGIQPQVSSFPKVYVLNSCAWRRKWGPRRRAGKWEGGPCTPAKSPTGLSSPLAHWWVYGRLSKLLTRAIRITQCIVFSPSPSWGHLCFQLECHLDTSSQDKHAAQRGWGTCKFYLPLLSVSLLKFPWWASVLRSSQGLVTQESLVSGPWWPLEGLPSLCYILFLTLLQPDMRSHHLCSSFRFRIRDTSQGQLGIKISAPDSCPGEWDLGRGQKRCLFLSPKVVLECVSGLSEIYTLTWSAALQTTMALVFKKQTRRNQNRVACCQAGWREKGKAGGGSTYKVTFTPAPPNWWSPSFSDVEEEVGLEEMADPSPQHFPKRAEVLARAHATSQEDLNVREWS